MSYSIDVENIKCGGCANSIKQKLDEAGHPGAEVDIEAGRVTIDGDGNDRDTVASALAKMGYPEVGSVEGLQSAAAKAKSVVSCAVGRIDLAIHDKS